MTTAAPCSLHPMETQPCAICTTGIRAAPAPDFAPPADAIDNLCADLRDYGRAFSDGMGIFGEAAAALQRLRAERDTLAAIVRAADAMRKEKELTWIGRARLMDAYDAARAKWEDK